MYKKMEKERHLHAVDSNTNIVFKIENVNYYTKTLQNDLLWQQ